MMNVRHFFFGPTRDQKLTAIERNLVRNRCHLEGQAQMMSNRSRGEQEQAFEALKRSNPDECEHHNFQAAVYEISQKKLRDGIRKLDGLAVQIPVIRSQGLLLDCMRESNALMKSAQNVRVGPSPAETAEQYENLTREMEVTNTEMDQVLFAPMGAVHERAKQQANEMTQRMVQDLERLRSPVAQVTAGTPPQVNLQAVR